MSKRIIGIGLALLMCVGLFGIAGCAGYDYMEGDFTLDIEVDKTEVKRGESFTVTATFTNISGKNIRVRANETYQKTVRDMVWIDAKIDGLYSLHVILVELGSLKEMEVKSDEVAVNTLAFEVPEDGAFFDVSANFIFHAGRGYSQKYTVYSDTIKVTVVEEKS